MDESRGSGQEVRSLPSFPPYPAQDVGAGEGSFRKQFNRTGNKR